MRIQKRLRVINPKGLHVRPAGRLIDCVNEFESVVSFASGDVVVDGRSQVDMLRLAAPQGSEVTVTAEGDDAQQVIEALEALFDAGFNEMEPDPSPKNE